MAIRSESIDHGVMSDPSEPEIGYGAVVRLHQRVVGLLGREVRITTGAEIRDTVGGTDEGFVPVSRLRAHQLIRAEQ